MPSTTAMTFHQAGPEATRTAPPRSAAALDRLMVCHAAAGVPGLASPRTGYPGRLSGPIAGTG
jgi:hypothetical protein